MLRLCAPLRFHARFRMADCTTRTTYPHPAPNVCRASARQEAAFNISMRPCTPTHKLV